MIKNNLFKITFPGVSGLVILFAMLLGSLFFTACEKEVAYEIDMGKPIELTASAQELLLSQRFMNNNALSFSWTTGTNQGTGSSISYKLEIDKSGNNFSSAKIYDLGKGVYEKSFTVDELNDLMLNQWNAIAGEEIELEARVSADVMDESVEDGISPLLKLSITPYLPVSSTLYIIGDATPKGWDADNAIALVPDNNNPTIFKFIGALFPGEFKFITTPGKFLPSYNKGLGSNQLFYRTDDAQADEPFVITEGGSYSILVDLVEQTIVIEALPGPPYEMLYMVGSATSIGWDITAALEVTQNPDNLFQFTYQGVLVPGEFKFPVNRQADWGQDMFMPNPEDSSLIYLHKGGDEDDNKWVIDKENFYTITLDLSDYTIRIDPFKLYFVGSATPAGWDIGNAIELEQDANSWYLFRYEGAMIAGEFKFPVNRQSDWAQDMYMKDPDDATKMYRHVGGEADDSKWVFTDADAGNYIITVNVQDLSIDIQKQ
ncbi:MAG: SusF/SusE family outer membrane protein [Prolixibacteraceae bacterium]